MAPVRPPDRPSPEPPEQVTEQALEREDFFRLEPGLRIGQPRGRARYGDRDGRAVQCQLSANGRVAIDNSADEHESAFSWYHSESRSSMYPCTVNRLDAFKVIHPPGKKMRILE